MLDQTTSPVNRVFHTMTLLQKRDAMRALNRAVRQVLDGNFSELARRVGITPQSIHLWTISGVVPVYRVRKVCEALEGAVEDYELRPDIFAAPSPAEG